MNKTHSFSSALVADYFLALAERKGQTLTPMQINKLVYIAHGFYMGYTGNPLIKEAVEAWQYGPVINSLYHRFKKYGGQAIYEHGTIPTRFPDTAKQVVEQVYDAYGNLSGMDLSAITHKKGTPWEVTYNGRPSRCISNDLIQYYYDRFIDDQVKTG